MARNDISLLEEMKRDKVRRYLVRQSHSYQQPEKKDSTFCVCELLTMGKSPPNTNIVMLRQLERSRSKKIGSELTHCFCCWQKKRANERTNKLDLSEDITFIHSYADDVICVFSTSSLASVVALFQPFAHFALDIFPHSHLDFMCCRCRRRCSLSSFSMALVFIRKFAEFQK